VLALEVVVDQGFVYSRFRGDLVDAGGVVALFGEYFFCRF
jgi:hypothetical protein